MQWSARRSGDRPAALSRSVVEKAVSVRWPSRPSRCVPTSRPSCPVSRHKGHLFVSAVRLVLLPVALTPSVGRRMEWDGKSSSANGCDHRSFAGGNGSAGLQALDQLSKCLQPTFVSGPQSSERRNARNTGRRRNCPGANCRTAFWKREHVYRCVLAAESRSVASARADGLPSRSK